MSDDSASADFGIWTDYRIPDDRSDWHPLVRRFYEYYRSITPPDRLPGRQHLVPEQMVPMLSRIWMLDVHREPLRFRYRLYGTALANSLKRDVTGRWMDEAAPEIIGNPEVRDRLRFMVEAGRPTWRRGPTKRGGRDPLHRIIENCVAPLAADGETVDIIVGVAVISDATGKEIPG
jgi:hypothetical protein